MVVRKKLVPLPKLLKKAQDVVNRYIRERDKDRGCIACNGPVEHAGHYFSQGHHSALRYDETNIHGSCAKCNLFLHGNLIHYRMGLVERYGEQYVKDLEQKAKQNKTYKWSRNELEEIINRYKPVRSTLSGLLKSENRL